MDLHMSVFVVEYWNKRFQQWLTLPLVVVVFMLIKELLFPWVTSRRLNCLSVTLVIIMRWAFFCHCSGVPILNLAHTALIGSSHSQHHVLSSCSPWHVSLVAYLNLYMNMQNSCQICKVICNLWATVICEARHNYYLSCSKITVKCCSRWLSHWTEHVLL